MRVKSSSSKTSLNVFFGKNLGVGLVVGRKEFDLGNVVNVCLNKNVNFITISSF